MAKALPNIVGLTGRRRAGKDTVGAYLVSHYGYRRYAFADDVKEFARGLGWDGDKSSDAGRELLQKVGMTARDIFGPNVWIRQVAAQIRAEQGDDQTKWLVVITDVRLPNEVAWVRERGGRVWRVNRPDAPGVVMPSYVDAHVSETSVDAIEPELDLFNNGTLAQLHELVSYIINTHTVGQVRAVATQEAHA